jgi:hypothetical protein
MKHLPYDIARCHDTNCHERLRCRRYLSRRNTSDHTPHLLAIREDMEDNQGRCLNKINVRKGE